MNILAIDARLGQPDNDPIGIALWSDDGGGYYADYDTFRLDAIACAVDGYTLIAHGAEQVVSTLLYRHHEHVRVNYRDEQFVFAQWHYDLHHEPMPIWDSRPLAGNLPIGKLVEAVGLEPYPTPQMYTWQYQQRWRGYCFEHKALSCPLCWGKIDRAQWWCADHQRGECDECWKLQHAQAVYLYMRRYAEMAEGYGFKPSRTIGGMAHRVWRHLDRPQPCRLPSDEMDRFARQGYFGGRVECFKLGECGLVCYGDISQMYASVLRDVTLPTPQSMRLVTDQPIPESVLEWPGVSDCTVTVPDLYLPPLPLRREHDIVYPVGQFRGHFTHGELRLALTRGCQIDAIHASLYGSEMCAPFEIFARGLMDWREDLRRKHDPLEVAVKLMLNSLYGYIGMRPTFESNYVMPLPPGTTMRDWPYHDVKVLRDHILMRRSSLARRRPKFSNPLWAALITAEARLRLYRHMEVYGADLLYVDTDSVIVWSEIQAGDGSPGELRFQGMYEESTILAPKMYRLQSVMGAPRMAHAGIPEWQVEQLLADGQIRRAHDVGVMEGFHTGLEPGRRVFMPTDRRYEMGKRIPLDPRPLGQREGWTDTRPIVLGPVLGE